MRRQRLYDGMAELSPGITIQSVDNQVPQGQPATFVVSGASVVAMANRIRLMFAYTYPVLSN